MGQNHTPKGRDQVEKLNVMLIDGDEVALSSMERLLAPYKNLHLIGSYSDPKQALATLDNYPVDVIFLDMDMQFINGLEVAARMRRICADAEIVVVTAELHYAVEAFNLNAMDYLLKPIEQIRLDQTIMKLLRRMERRQF
jgi:two-component system LytT family response regulator